MTRYQMIGAPKIESPVEVRDISRLDRPLIHPIPKLAVPQPHILSTPPEPGQHPPNEIRRLMGMNTRKFI